MLISKILSWYSSGMKVIIFVLTLIQGVSFAETRKTDMAAWDGTEVLQSQIIQKKLDSKLDLSLLAFEIGKSTIPEILKNMGSDKSKNGIGPICYKGSDNSFISFVSQAGDETGTLYEIQMSMGEKAKDCVLSKRVNLSISNGRGVKLNLSKAQVIKILGEPSRKIKTNDWGYMYTSPDKNDGGEFTETYRIKFNNDKVQFFSISSVSMG